jgi:hypothetical protein
MTSQQVSVACRCVIPAQAGIHFRSCHRVGVERREASTSLDSSVRWNDGQVDYGKLTATSSPRKNVIPDHDRGPGSVFVLAAGPELKG